MSPFSTHILVFNPEMAWTTVGLFKTQLMWKVYGIQFILFFLIPTKIIHILNNFQMHADFYMICFIYYILSLSVYLRSLLSLEAAFYICKSLYRSPFSLYTAFCSYMSLSLLDYN